MKFTAILALATSASAFSPMPVQKATSALSASAEGMVGILDPVGFFDPLGFAEKATDATLKRYREAELAHGRVSMLAVTGYLVTAAGIRLPGNIDYSGDSFASIPGGFDALKNIPGGGLVQLFFLIGFLEIFVMKDSANGAEPGEFIGDFRNGVKDFGWDKFDEETKFQKRAIELNQGRAAMMGILALMVHEKLGVSLLPGGVFGG